MGLLVDATDLVGSSPVDFVQDFSLWQTNGSKISKVYPATHLHIGFLDVLGEAIQGHR